MGTAASVDAFHARMEHAREVLSTVQAVRPKARGGAAPMRARSASGSSGAGFGGAASFFEKIKAAQFDEHDDAAAHASNHGAAEEDNDQQKPPRGVAANGRRALPSRWSDRGGSSSSVDAELPPEHVGKHHHHLAASRPSSSTMERLFARAQAGKAAAAAAEKRRAEQARYEARLHALRAVSAPTSRPHTTPEPTREHEPYSPLRRWLNGESISGTSSGLLYGEGDTDDRGDAEGSGGVVAAGRAVLSSLSLPTAVGTPPGYSIARPATSSAAITSSSSSSSSTTATTLSPSSSSGSAVAVTSAHRPNQRTTELRLPQLKETTLKSLSAGAALQLRESGVRYALDELRQRQAGLE
jgi:hypothetical protein